MAALGSKMAPQLQAAKAFASKMGQELQAKGLALDMAQLQSAKAYASKMAQELQAKALAVDMAQLQSKAGEAASFAAKHGTEYSKALLESNKQSMAALAAKTAQMQSKAGEAARSAAKQGCAYHKTVMERNKQYVVDPPTAEKCRELSKQLFYTRIASLPGRYESFWKEIDGVKLLLKNRENLKIEHAGVAALFGIELYAWLCAGEIVGRGFTLTGYHV